MSKTPHPDNEAIAIGYAVITVSDTRTQETDQSGELIQELFTTAGYIGMLYYAIIPDEPIQVKSKLTQLCYIPQIDAIIINGGTGIAPRDTTYDVLENLLEKTLPGFGELFRFLSYQEIGSRAIASRAVAGVYQGKLIFSLPGSTNAVKLAVEKLILPELVHLVKQLRG
ncbi:MAG: MogA/MoaB family molybdenum cofactor biosynthesis protein [Gomphosphaeria aponina SAG 52.96 = DSM 107014]|uniref:Molybdenum cofactor biosynthesis protein B n=1 Tax=Gomphosphaeria aponina SAG 52.96 = DSM 107014 TaxID=1521640 RepID=A0A941GYB4_9CHRO|nr:MogA/MoaB family molybdenum cofactor biosynthesis protein [Gomphosphaeria aponina SAG 52.96 = DSM 107014]